MTPDLAVSETTSSALQPHAARATRAGARTITAIWRASGEPHLHQVLSEGTAVDDSVLSAANLHAKGHMRQARGKPSIRIQKHL